MDGHYHVLCNTCRAIVEQCKCYGETPVVYVDSCERCKPGEEHKVVPAPVHEHTNKICLACGNTMQCRCKGPKRTEYVDSCYQCNPPPEMAPMPKLSSQRTAAVNRLEPLAELSLKDMQEATRKLQTALNMMRLMGQEARGFLPKNYQRRPGLKQKGDAFYAVAEMADEIVKDFEKANILHEANRIMSFIQETVSETKAWMADVKTASDMMPVRVMRRYAGSSVMNRIRDVHQWMNEALARTHQSEQFLKGIQSEVAMMAHGGDHAAKAHADHLKKALDGILRVEKETRALVDGLDHLAREFK
jgi:hypothetical protein